MNEQASVMGQMMLAAGVGAAVGALLQKIVLQVPAPILRELNGYAAPVKGGGSHLVQLVASAASIFVAWRFGPTWQGAAALLFVYLLICLSFIDAQHCLLPDLLTLPMLWAGLLVNIHGLFAPLQDAVLGAAGGYVLLFAVTWVAEHIFRRDGMGRGDFKMLAALGAWLGWQEIPAILVVAGASATAAYAIQRWRGRVLDNGMPFGPFLTAGAVFTMFYNF